ncbi:MAG: hypothetical protein QNJ54_12785 [Prochloraceae cyanobacterium]|nr:hypothetical protein [Prochloraceae cyanobacterium]
MSSYQFPKDNELYDAEIVALLNKGMIWPNSERGYGAENNHFIPHLSNANNRIKERILGRNR